MIKTVCIILLFFSFAVSENEASKASLTLRQLVNGKCTTYGRFVLASTNCKQYTLCRRTITGLVASNVTCPTTTMFNQVRQMCVTNYNCPETVCTNNGANGNGTAETKVADPNSSDCSSYIKCTTSEGGAVTGVVESCPDGQLFDPEEGDCNSTYVCPTV